MMVAQQTIAGISGALAIGCGAFGAHALKGNVDDKMMKAFETGAQYHLAHSVALLVLAKSRSAPMDLTGKLFLTGITLFSGSLYLMAVTDQRKIGAITPIGGLALMAGWLSLAL